MTAHQVRFLPAAADELASLNRPAAQRILNKLRWLAENFENLTPEPLRGDLQGLFKLRVGSYRVLYSFDQTTQVITVHLVGHRENVYRSRGSG